MRVENWLANNAVAPSVDFQAAAVQVASCLAPDDDTQVRHQVVTLTREANRAIGRDGVAQGLRGEGQ